MCLRRPMLSLSKAKTLKMRPFLIQRSCRLQLMAVILLTGLCYYYLSFRRKHHQPISLNNLHIQIQSGKNNYQTDLKRTHESLDKSQGCIAPKLRVDDPGIIHLFYEKAPEIKCESQSENDWVSIQNGIVTFDAGMESKYGKFSCSANYINFVNDQVIKFGDSFPLTTETEIKNDFLKIKCTASNGKIFEKIYANVVPLSGKSVKNFKHSADWSGLSVYILGFSSISGLTALRILTDTHEYLVRDLSTVFFDQYNIVGDGTSHSFIPILTGKSEDELPLTQKRHANANFLDKAYKMIWQDFSKSGYVTLFGEDTAKYGMFTERLKGFEKQPTDHYMRPFYLAKEQKNQTSKCEGTQKQHDQFLNYAEQFFDAYPKEIPKFGLMFHRSLSHDNLNHIEAADRDILSHLQRLKAKGHLDNTLLIFTSDHGQKIRNMHQGQLEERLPVLGVALPKDFLQNNARGMEALVNLQKNSHRLVTPFDLYSTLSDVLNWPVTLRKAKADEKSISLFHEVPKDRSCTQAGVDPHFCTCLFWQELENDHRTSRMLGESIVYAINKETNQNRTKCAKFSVSSVESVACLAPHPNLLKYRGFSDADGLVPDLRGQTEVEFAKYEVKIVAEPGNVLYEAFVDFDSRTMNVVIDLDTIVRADFDRTQVNCIEDRDSLLAKLCVCYE